MEIKMSAELESQFKDASKMLGFVEQEVFERAILFYLEAMKKEIEMKKEFQELDTLSDEAFVDFEKAL